MSDAVFKALLPLLPSIVIAIARILAKKLAEVGGVTPTEAAALELLDVLEKMLSAETG